LTHTHKDLHPEKPTFSIVLTDEGISIPERDMDPQNPPIYLKRLSDEKIISFSDMHSRKPHRPRVSIDEAISIHLASDVFTV
jgi:hypothetical protein